MFRSGPFGNWQWAWRGPTGCFAFTVTRTSWLQTWLGQIKESIGYGLTAHMGERSAHSFKRDLQVLAWNALLCSLMQTAPLRTTSRTFASFRVLTWPFGTALALEHASFSSCIIFRTSEVCFPLLTWDKKSASMLWSSEVVFRNQPAFRGCVSQRGVVV